jgi:hypothetical protein
MPFTTATRFAPYANVLECIDWICGDTAQCARAEFKYAEAQQIFRDVAAMGITL